MATKACPFLALWRWIARATNSFPVPLSPVINTGTPNHVKDHLHLITSPHQAFEVVLADLLLEWSIFLFQVGEVGRALEDDLQDIELNRLLDKVVAAACDRRDGLRSIAIARDHDDLGHRVES